MYDYYDIYIVYCTLSLSREPDEQMCAACGVTDHKAPCISFRARLMLSVSSIVEISKPALGGKGVLKGGVWEVH